MAEKISNGDAALAAAAALAQSVGSPQSTNASNLNKKRTPDQYTKNFDLNEIKPLNNDSILPYSEEETSRLNGGADDSIQKLEQVNLNLSGASAVDGNDRALLPDNRTERNFIKGTYESMLSRLDISQKAKLPFLIAVSLCAIFLIILIVLISFWPRIPYYMKADICVDKECIDASAQVRYCLYLYMIF